MATKLTELLRKISIFERLPEVELAKIARLLKERRFAEDQVLFRQGDRGDSLYIVTHGRVKIWITDQFGREKVLAFNGEGEFFGEMAVLTGAPRSAGATATTDVRVLQLRKDDFDVLLSSNVEVMKEMLRLAALRQADTNQRVTQEAMSEAGGGHGLVTVVFSPRGGSGRTTIATNLAIALAQESPDRVVLADLDLLFGHTSVMLNITPRTALGAASPSAIRSMDRESFAYYLTAHDDSSLRVMVGATRPEEGEAVTGEHVRAAIELLQKQYVHVVVDTSRGFSDANLAALELADLVLMVATPELAAIRDTRECQRIFFDLLGFRRDRFVQMLNHPLPYTGVPATQIEQALEVPIKYEIPFGGDAPSLAALDGMPLIARWPNNATSKAILALSVDVNRQAQELLALAGR